MTVATPDVPVVPTALPGRIYRSYALGLLMLIYVVNFVDRQVVTILAEPIKRDLHLADWQLGLMTGLAFAVLYTVLGLPIARMAERSFSPMRRTRIPSRPPFGSKRHCWSLPRASGMGSTHSSGPTCR